MANYVTGQPAMNQFDPATMKPKTPQEYAQWNAWQAQQQQALNQSVTGQPTSNSSSPLPGETYAAYQQRMIDTGMNNEASNPGAAKDAYQLKSLQDTEEAKSRAILGEQGDLQKTRLSDLAKLLTDQQTSQFNRDIPGIANTAQGAGMLETSGFGGALANRYKDLSAATSNAIAKQGLADRDLQIQGLGAIGTNSNNLSTAGLQRTYSTEDLTRSEELARELGRMGVPAPAQQPSTSDKLIGAAGPILSGVGSIKAA